jgi:hypothetical protein
VTEIKNGEQKDLTREEVRTLAKAKWGNSYYLHRTRRIRATPYTVGFSLAGTWKSESGATWREACERAGLLQAEAAR